MDVTPAFEREIARLRAAAVPGASGRLRELFDFLAERGADAEPATQDQIARAVFGQDGSDADDATVRVYVHRLRKRLEEFYAGTDPAAPRIDLPTGIYALRLVPDHATPAFPGQARASNERLSSRALMMAAGLLVLALVAALGWSLWARPSAPNPIWEPLLASDRPILVVLGDYYIYGEIDPVRPEQSRLIRDFRVDSAQDLSALQEAEPTRYGLAEDVGLNYLPFSLAYAMRDAMPILSGAGRPVDIIAASALEPDMLNRYDVVYLGLLSGLGLLEQPVFENSNFRIGESYDELVERGSERVWTSQEMRSLPSPAVYRDHAYVTRFTASTGAQVLVIASQRETGLRGVSQLVTAPAPLDGVAISASRPFEVLVQVTGQQGADLDHEVLREYDRR